MIGFKGFLRSEELFGLPMKDVSNVKENAVLVFGSLRLGSEKGVHQSVITAPSNAVEWFRKLLETVPKRELLIRRVPPVLGKCCLLLS